LFEQLDGDAQALLRVHVGELSFAHVPTLHHFDTLRPQEVHRTASVVLPRFDAEGLGTSAVVIAVLPFWGA
jgi:hypothetical protein